MKKGLAALALLAGFYAPLPTLLGRMKRPLLKEGEKPRMLLTFDDGPSGRNTPRLLETLKEYKVPALFFVLSEKARRAPGLLRRIESEGHALGFHGAAHAHPLLSGPITSYLDFEAGIGTLRGLGATVRYYRPAHGCFNAVGSWRAAAHSLTPVLWTKHVADWKKQGIEELLEKLRAARQPGAVLLLHDASEDTGGEAGAFDTMHEALKIFLPESREMGYEFVGADALIRRHG